MTLAAAILDRPAEPDERTLLSVDCGNCWPFDCDDDCTPYCERPSLCVFRLMKAAGLLEANELRD
jgi:hypothetical protein